MVVLSAFRRTLGLLADHPVLLPAVALLNVVPQVFSLPRVLNAGQGAEIAGSLAGLLLGPLFLVPALSLVDAAADDGAVSVSAATDAYGRRVASLVGANLVVLVVAVGLIALVVGFTAILGPFGLVLGLAGFLAFGVALQFVDVAVVVADERAVDAVSNSVEVARRHTAAAVGFAVLRAVVGVGAALPFLLASNALPDGTFRLTANAALLGVLALAVSSVLLAYRVVFYRRLTANSGRGTPDPALGPEGAR